MPGPTTRTETGRLRGLLLLNAALLMVLGTITFGSHVQAQQRPRGQYNMVSGGVNGAETPAVWIIDGASQELIAITYDPNSKDIAGIGYRNIAADAGRTGANRR
ncbi:MAG: hypothetical protein AAF432_05875 [Planctomycetota bacterium]